MNDDVYKPPQAEVGSREELKPRSAVLAVVVGGLVDWVGTIVISVVGSAVYGAMLAVDGQTPEQIAEIARRGFGAWSPAWLIFVLAGTAMSLAGGYVCAVIARRSPSPS